VTVLAHGGTAGAIVEALALVALAALVFVVSRRDRARPDEPPDGEPRDSAGLRWRDRG
jgi:hypothetical protein